LQRSYKVLASEGKAGFYQGSIGQSIVAAVNRRGGVLTMQDLANHASSQPVEPISIDYHDHTVWEIPPNGQGITALMALGIIEALETNGSVDFTQLDHNSAAYLHVVIEALRLAFADTRYYVGDPDVVHVPVQELLSKVNTHPLMA
jgi:gamma-glutamyltranspeptidase/glutathione hydrolase